MIKYTILLYKKLSEENIEKKYKKRKEKVKNEVNEKKLNTKISFL